MSQSGGRIAIIVIARDNLNNPVKCKHGVKTCRVPFGGDYTHYTQDGLNTIRK